jgi:Zn-finger protein
MSFFIKEIPDNITLPQPFYVCEDCGGGSWKKIKKGSDIEKYLIFCRCDYEETLENQIIEETLKNQIIEENQDSTDSTESAETEQSSETKQKSDNEQSSDNEELVEEKKPEIPKHLRSRFKPKHHKDRKWVENLNISDD